VKSFDIFLVSIFSFICLAPFGLKSQTDYPFDISYYNFIQYDKNKFDFPGDSLAFERLFFKMDTLMLMGTGKITIVHKH